MSDTEPISIGARPVRSTEAVRSAEAARPRARRLSAPIAAAQFLTRIRLPTSAPGADADTLRRSPVYFPLVATLIGAFTAALIGLGSRFWPVWLAVPFALAVEARLTGALHEDAVADFCDAFGGGWTREEVLRILKDSRLGSYGALGLALAVALRAGATISVVMQQGGEAWPSWVAAVVASAAVGRWAMVAATVLVPPDKERESLARQVGGQLSWRELLEASFWTLPAAGAFAVLMPEQFALAVVLLVPTLWFFLRGVHRKLGGVTGDCLGCLGYLAQVVVLLAAAARIGS